MVWKRTEADDPPATPSRGPASSPAPAPRAASAGGRAIIGPSITVEGDITGEEDLTILGRVKGTVDVKEHSATIGDGGRVEADVYAKTIVVEGRVEGNLFGGDQVVLRSTAHVRGNLTAPRVALDDGAQFKGAIDMEPNRKAVGSERAAASKASPEDRPGGSGAPSDTSGTGRPGGSGGSPSEKSASGSGSDGGDDKVKEG